MAYARRLLPAAGTPVLTDNIAALVGGLDTEIQVVKWVAGAEGLLVPISLAAGAVDAGTLRHTLASNDPAVVKLELIEAFTAAVKDVATNAVRSLFVEPITGDPLDTTGPVPTRGVTPDGNDDPTPYPFGVGGRPVAHGANPTAAAVGAIKAVPTNRIGMPFIMGGHPNVISRAHLITDANGAQTNVALSPTVAVGTIIVCTRLSVICDNANTGDIAVTIGFGATVVPTPTLAGANGILAHGSFDGGAGVTLGDGSGIIGIGGDAEELRMTCSDPVGGNLRVSYSYFTIEN